jgi:hypothetical protein
MTDPSVSPNSSELPMVIERPRISMWVWKPWYAKLWWSLTAIYWILGVGAFFIRPLADIYTSDIAYVLHVVFYPVFAFVLMSFGWAGAWLDALDLAAAHPEAENKLGWVRSYEPDGIHERWMRSYRDPHNIYSPLSGNMSVGSPNNPMHASYPNR